ncbi:unnamed protein product [Aphanomyces euteiches]
MQHQVRPSTLVAGPLIKPLAGSPFRLLTKEEPWLCEGPRLAAISAFGFGGNNAHLIVEQYTANTEAVQRRTQQPKHPDVKAVRGDLAIVGIGAIVANGNDTRDFSAALFGLDRSTKRRGQESVIGKAEQISFSIRDTSTPPSDLLKTLPQQLQILQAAKEAVAEAGFLPSERTGIFVGMQCDGVLSRHGARLRTEDWHTVWSEAGSDPLLSEEWLRTAREQWFPSLDAATVVGLLPNIPANRLNKQFNVSGPGFTVSSEELSGITALAIASRALRFNELDAAIVGAVDMSSERIHETAASALGELAPLGDAAVVLVLKRLEDAEKDGNTIYAILPGEAEASKEPLLKLGSSAGTGSIRLDKRFGKAQAADGLLHVAAGALAIRHKMLPVLKDLRPRPWVTEAVKTARISIKALGDVSAVVDLTEYRGEGNSKPAIIAEVPRYKIFSGASRAEVLRDLLEGREGSAGPSRLAIVYTGKDDWNERKSAAIEWLQSTNIPNPAVYNGKDIYYRDQPIAGELAFVFAGAATAYQGIGGELQAIIPELSADVLTRFKEAEQAADWLYGEQTTNTAEPLQLLGASSFICQLHAEFSRHWLGLKPQSVIGLSSGETNALAAMGVWPNLDGLFEALQAKGIYDQKLAGTFEDKAAEALLGMAGGMIDFPQLIQNAWNDGARIFVEHGPRDLCSQWIRRILGDQEHVCIALDQPGESSLKQAVTAAAQLAVAGALLDDSKLLSRLDERSVGTKLEMAGTTANLPTFIVPAHMAAVQLPTIQQAGVRQHSAPIPALAAEIPPLTAAVEPTRHKPTAAAETPPKVTNEAIGTSVITSVGKPSDGFGKFYEWYDGGKHSLRLPGPPYHFMTRVVSIEGKIGVPAVGSSVEAEYDIPQDAWYFAENGNKTMPYSVMMEAALQPCGWLVSYLGIPESREKDMYFRNLDGCGTVSRMGYTYIEGFKVECFLANSDQAVYTLDTVFGHFTQEDLGKQVGIPRTEDELEQLAQPSDFIVMLKEEPARYYGGELRLARGKLLLLDQVNGYWPQDGKKGLGRLRAEKEVLPGDCGMGEGLQHPRFEPVMLGDPGTWKYRGQVTPLNKVVTTEVEISEVGADEDGPDAYRF